jgi:hypothetical protein
MFRGKRARDNHILFNQCTSNYSVSESATGTQGQEIEIQVEYYGREYTDNPIPTGNRQYRCGIPLPRISKEGMRCAI